MSCRYTLSISNDDAGPKLRVAVVPFNPLISPRPSQDGLLNRRWSLIVFVPVKKYFFEGAKERVLMLLPNPMDPDPLNSRVSMVFPLCRSTNEVGLGLVKTSTPNPVLAMSVKF